MNVSNLIYILFVLFAVRVHAVDSIVSLDEARREMEKTQRINRERFETQRQIIKARDNENKLSVQDNLKELQEDIFKGFQIELELDNKAMLERVTQELKENNSIKESLKAFRDEMEKFKNEYEQEASRSIKMGSCCKDRICTISDFERSCNFIENTIVNDANEANNSLFRTLSLITLKTDNAKGMNPDQNFCNTCFKKAYNIKASSPKYKKASQKVINTLREKKIANTIGTLNAFNHFKMALNNHTGILDTDKLKLKNIDCYSFYDAEEVIQKLKTDPACRENEAVAINYLSKILVPDLEPSKDHAYNALRLILGESSGNEFQNENIEENNNVDIDKGFYASVLIKTASIIAKSSEVELNKYCGEARRFGYTGFRLLKNIILSSNKSLEEKEHFAKDMLRLIGNNAGFAFYTLETENICKLAKSKQVGDLRKVFNSGDLTGDFLDDKMQAAYDFFNDQINDINVKIEAKKDEDMNHFRSLVGSETGMECAHIMENFQSAICEVDEDKLSFTDISVELDDFESEEEKLIVSELACSKKLGSENSFVDISENSATSFSPSNLDQNINNAIIKRTGYDPSGKGGRKKSLTSGSLFSSSSDTPFRSNALANYSNCINKYSDGCYERVSKLSNVEVNPVEVKNNSALVNGGSNNGLSSFGSSDVKFTMNDDFSKNIRNLDQGVVNPINSQLGESSVDNTLNFQDIVQSDFAQTLPSLSDKEIMNEFENVQGDLAKSLGTTSENAQKMLVDELSQKSNSLSDVLSTDPANQDLLERIKMLEAQLAKKVNKNGDIVDTPESQELKKANERISKLENYIAALENKKPTSIASASGLGSSSSRSLTNAQTSLGSVEGGRLSAINPSSSGSRILSSGFSDPSVFKIGEMYENPGKMITDKRARFEFSDNRLKLIVDEGKPIPVSLDDVKVQNGKIVSIVFNKKVIPISDVRKQLEDSGSYTALENFLSLTNKDLKELLVKEEKLKKAPSRSIASVPESVVSESEKSERYSKFVKCFLDIDKSNNCE